MQYNYASIVYPWFPVLRDSGVLLSLRTLYNFCKSCLICILSTFCSFFYLLSLQGRVGMTPAIKKPPTATGQGKMILHICPTCLTSGHVRWRAGIPVGVPGLLGMNRMSACRTCANFSQSVQTLSRISRVSPQDCCSLPSAVIGQSSIFK